MPVCLIYLSVYLFACLSHIFICLFVCLPVSYLSIVNPPTCQYTYSQFALMFHIFLLVYDIYLSLKRYLFKHLCICLSIYLATLSLSSSLSPPPLYHKTLLDSKAIFRKVLKRAGAPPPPPSCAHRKPWTTLPRCTLVRMRVVRGGGVNIIYLSHLPLYLNKKHSALTTVLLELNPTFLHLYLLNASLSFFISILYFFLAFFLYL